ncbi:hypothetical protein [Micromonospora aurantiaca (nom. illeg.)]|uniref:hypothetical protein n=1 Tax=Micromonospora aurantiaca (nom. illeg.) TaxID=47850 RepID=UPI0033DA11C1
MIAHPTPPAGSAPVVRPGDVVDIGHLVDLSRPAGYRLHLTDRFDVPGANGSTALRGWVLNRSGARRRTRDGQPRSCWVPLDRLVLATIEVLIAGELRPVPLAVGPGEDLPLPLLPVLSWQESIAVCGSGAAWPNTGAYLDAHLHRHEQCGHLSRCGFPGRDEPCQAVECYTPLCEDCPATPAGIPTDAI